MDNPKKKLAARLYDAIWPPKDEKRHYAAGRRTKANADWVTQTTSETWEQRQSLMLLRARARFAAKNDPFLARYLAITRANVIGGSGIALQSQAMKSDDTFDIDTNKIVENAWEAWGHAETCTVSGKLNWKGVQDLVATQVECDGESLVQMIPAANDFGFALKVWSVDYLSEFYNTINPQTRNRIIMSVEIDQFDKPVAYHLTTPPSDRQFIDRRNIDFQRYAVRIPAEEMLHIFQPRVDETQVRGVTAFAHVLLTAKNYQGYLQGVVMSARMAANTFGFIKQTVPDENPWNGAEGDEGRGTLPDIDSRPTSINLLNPGQEFQQFDPKQPTQNHAAFAKTILMELGAGLGIPYFLLANDWEATNFSSSRGGLEAVRDMWREKQQFLAATLHRRVFQKWARAAFLNKQLDLTPKQFAAIQEPAWKGRGWKYIDPSKDVTTTVTALENKLTTWTDDYAERGLDFITEMKKLKAEQAIAKAMGIDLVAVSTIKVTDAGTAPADDEGKPAPAAKDTGKPPKRELTNGHGHELLN